MVIEAYNMAELKTKKNSLSPKKFLNKIDDESQKNDCLALLEIMATLTGQKPSMWGTSIVGFGSYHYKYESGREGEWPATAFSPRKQNISIYIMPGFNKYQTLLEKLGKYKTGKSCLYIKKLDDRSLDIFQNTLKKLIKRGYADIKKIYP